jgi:hypothetical protein
MENDPVLGGMNCGARPEVGTECRPLSIAAPGLFCKKCEPMLF